MDWIGAGIGSMVAADAVVTTDIRKEIFLICPPMQPRMLTIKDARTEYFKNWDVAAFADLQLGRVRVGPAVGLRYLYWFSNTQSKLFIYATWRL
jgi:hypothetical protein